MGVVSFSMWKQMSYRVSLSMQKRTPRPCSRPADGRTAPLLHCHVRDLWRRDDGEGGHDAVWVLHADLADQQRAHARPSAAT